MAALPALTRRGLLALGATAVGGWVLAACGGGPEKTGPPSAKGDGLTKVPYADAHPDQFGILGKPDVTPKGLVVLVHGGYWLAQYQAGLMDALATDLRKRGYATWNIEYRRVGAGGGYPETFEDAAAAFDKIADLDLPAGLAVTSVGHSAGGQLAAWAASRTDATPGGPARVVPTTTISLSGVLDLTAGVGENLGNGAVPGLMGGPPEGDRAASYQLADPSELVPARGRVIAVHAEDDDIVPLDQSTGYVQLDTAAGGEADLVKVPGGHFDLIDPGSDAWAKVVDLLP